MSRECPECQEEYDYYNEPYIEEPQEEIIDKLAGKSLGADNE